TAWVCQPARTDSTKKLKFWLQVLAPNLSPLELYKFPSFAGSKCSKKSENLEGKLCSNSVK
ncbi:unnamed protein product, partial [Musa textilis]